MLYGHGDDLYRYAGQIKVNFSSNIYAKADLSALKKHLASRLDLISNYPEPQPQELERVIATRCGIKPDELMVTNGATEAIYIIARSFKRDDAGRQLSHIIVQPTFSEYADACRQADIEPLAENRGVDGRKVHWFCNPNNPTGRVVGDRKSVV